MYIHGWKLSWDTTKEGRTLHEYGDEPVERSVSNKFRINDLFERIFGDIGLIFIRFDVFSYRALYSHFTGILGAASCDKPGKPFMAAIVGAAYEHEITLMNSLTVNLHLMMQVYNHVSKMNMRIVLYSYT